MLPKKIFKCVIKMLFALFLHILVAFFDKNFRLSFALDWAESLKSSSKVNWVNIKSQSVSIWLHNPFILSFAVIIKPKIYLNAKAFYYSIMKLGFYRFLLRFICYSTKHLNSNWWRLKMLSQRHKIQNSAIKRRVKGLPEKMKFNLWKYASNVRTFN